ncbi:MAG: hypothetical protein OHK0039_45830 [Bacteroidia bacterium]
MSVAFITDYRELLYPIAYNLLGNASDAEDLVQETMLKWLSMEQEEVENARGYLVRTLINKGLNFMRDRKRAFDKATAAETGAVSLPGYIEAGPTLALGLLALLEKLNPTERAIFMLKEVFGYSHREIADILGISEENCRQILARARRRLQEDKVRYLVDRQRHEQLYRTFLEVCQGEDLGELLEILKEDIRIDISRPAAYAGGLPVGRLAVAEYLRHLYRSGWRYELVQMGPFTYLRIRWQDRTAGQLWLEGSDTEVAHIALIEGRLASWEIATPAEKTAAYLY